MALSDLRDRLILSIETHGDLAQRIMVVAIFGLCAVGAYYAGQNRANHWWRSQIAQKSAAAAAIERACQSSCVAQDQRMLEAFAHDYARPAHEAETAVARAREEGRREALRAAGAARPVCSIDAGCVRD